MKLVKTILATAAFLLIAACGTIQNNVTLVQEQAVGIGGTQKPDGTLSLNLGWQQVGAATTPFIQKQADGSMTAVRVTGPCGRSDTASVYASLSGNSNAAVATSQGPSASVNVGTALASGEPAKLIALALVQDARKDSSALQDYEDCSKSTPPVQQTAKAGPVQ